MEKNKIKLIEIICGKLDKNDVSGLCKKISNLTIYIEIKNNTLTKLYRNDLCNKIGNKKGLEIWGKIPNCNQN